MFYRVELKNHVIVKALKLLINIDQMLSMTHNLLIKKTENKILIYLSDEILSFFQEVVHFNGVKRDIQDEINEEAIDLVSLSSSDPDE